MIVGSTALSYFGMNRRSVGDLDIWTDDTHYLPKDKVDFHIIPTKIMEMIYNLCGHCNPDQIYTIKCSHAVYDIHWEKTKLDILWLKVKGCELVEPLYSALKEHWKEEKGNKEFLSLKQSKEDFFTDNVTYVVDHDYLHELVAYPNKPIYTKVLKDGEEVLIDKGKFDKLSFEDQVRMFREEISVIAAERWLINPHWRGKVSWYKAYILSLRKTVTSLTKGWASEFMVSNLEQFVKPKFEYFEHLIKTLTGEVIMSKVDMKVFEDLKEVCGSDKSMDHIVYCLAAWEFGELVEYGGDYDKWKVKAAQLQDQLGYVHLEQEGGGEGGSEYCYGVFQLGGKIYKAEYSYYSHHGHDYDGILSTLREVTPKEKTITVYE